MKKKYSIFSICILVLPAIDIQAQKIKITNLPSLGFYNSTDVYKGFVWQGPGDNMSLGTSVGNSSGRLEFYNNGTLNMSLSAFGKIELRGTVPSITLYEGATQSGSLSSKARDIELSAWKPANVLSTPGNLLLQTDYASQLGNQYAGNVGIHTSNPVNRLQIGSSPDFSGNDICIGNGTQGMSFFQSATASHWYTNTNFVLLATGSGTGNVGIGTSNPTYKLSVNGGIRAKEIRINTGWADYVFNTSYKLMPLQSVEEYIIKNKRLPGIPPASRLQKEGVDVSAMQTKMMAKIEELTLYLIEANKTIEKLIQRLDALEKHIH